MIKVLNPGFYTTIQDVGRIGFQEYGVPYSGIMDRRASVLVNVLLGNDINDAVIEMTMTGVKLKFETETHIAISGANMSPKLNDNVIQLNKIVAVKPDDVLCFGKLTSGYRCYLGVLGGIKSESVMRSRSMYQNITKQFHIRKSDELKISEVKLSKVEKYASIKFDSSYLISDEIEVFKGPEFELLSVNQRTQLLTKVFTISKDNNRMAYQLEEILQNNLNPIITSAVLPGTVQLTPSGKLIILMRDCQTTGGYPRVFQLKESSIDVLAQKFTGKTINFKLNSKY